MKHIFVSDHLSATVGDGVAKSFMERIWIGRIFSHGSLLNESKRKFQAPIIYNVLFGRASYRRKFS